MVKMLLSCIENSSQTWFFLDIMMPEYDGIFGLEEIRKINPDAKVIIVTADENPKDLEKISSLNPHAIITKPFSLNDIQGVLQNLSTENKSWVSIAIERSLLDIGFNALDTVRDRLSNDYHISFDECYENPDFLNRILKDLYGDAHKAIVESIKKNLRMCERVGQLLTFEELISK